MFESVEEALDMQRRNLELNLFFRNKKTPAEVDNGNGKTKQRLVKEAIQVVMQMHIDGFIISCSIIVFLYAIFFISSLIKVVFSQNRFSLSALVFCISNNVLANSKFL